MFCFAVSAAMEVSTVWIFFAFSLIFSLYGSQADNQMCKTAIFGYLELGAKQTRAFTDLVQHVSEILGREYDNVTPNTSADAVIEKVAVNISAFCPQFNLTAQSVQNMINDCSHPDQCQGSILRIPAPDVYRAAAELCQSTQAREFFERLQVLVPCLVSLSQKWREPSEADDVTGRVSQLLTREWETFENLTYTCGPLCGRKCACRSAQIVVPLYTQRPNAHIKEVCGHKVHDLVLELQERVLNAFHCSEFGDYDKEWDWLKVKYQAKKTMLAGLQ